MSIAKSGKPSITVEPQSPRAPRCASGTGYIGPIDPYLHRSRRGVAWQAASCPKPWHPSKKPLKPASASTADQGEPKQVERLTGRRHNASATAAQSGNIIADPPQFADRHRHKKVTGVSFVSTMPNTSLTARRFSVSRFHRRKSLEASKAAFCDSIKPKSHGMVAPAREPAPLLSQRDRPQPLTGRRHFSKSGSTIPPWISA